MFFDVMGDFNRGLTVIEKWHREFAIEKACHSIRGNSEKRNTL